MSEGRLVGIARTAELKAPMEQVARAAITIEAGLEGDARGRKLNRQVTVLFREGWSDACRAVNADLPWTTRRANLLVEGFSFPKRPGFRLAIADTILEVTMETEPCMLMERAQTGLRAAMMPGWRGGVCCRVIRGGEIAIGDRVLLQE